MTPAEQAFSAAVERILEQRIEELRRDPKPRKIRTLSELVDAICETPEPPRREKRS